MPSLLWTLLINGSKIWIIGFRPGSQLDRDSVGWLQQSWDPNCKELMVQGVITGGQLLSCGGGIKLTIVYSAWASYGLFAAFSQISNPITVIGIHLSLFSTLT